jgi:hypothetical protein
MRPLAGEDMVVLMPKTLTDAINSQPASVEVVGMAQTSTTVREVPYAEIYRESTGIRETPVQRLQRVADADVPAGA